MAMTIYIFSAEEPFHVKSQAKCKEINKVTVAYVKFGHKLSDANLQASNFPL